MNPLRSIRKSYAVIAVPAAVFGLLRPQLIQMTPGARPEEQPNPVR